LSPEFRSSPRCVEFFQAFCTAIFCTTLNWAQSTDRDIDFTRTYSRRYYEYAVRWVYNAVGASRTHNPVRKMIFIAKGWLAQLLMQLSG
jgi:hypothetical protein